MVLFKKSNDDLEISKMSSLGIRFYYIQDIFLEILQLLYKTFFDRSLGFWKIAMHYLNGDTYVYTYTYTEYPKSLETVEYFINYAC